MYRSSALRRRTCALLLPLLLGACAGDRERPLPLEGNQTARLSVQLGSPASGITVIAGEPVSVRVVARDLDRRALQGVGFLARRIMPGLAVIDSAALRFESTADSAHTFSFIVPASYTTNSQIEVFGLAFGPAGQTRVSEPSFLVVVRCVDGVCQ